MTRPDPDTLLQRITEEAGRERRGRLKVFFGFAPGVGKTYRMLQVARDLVDQKVDVVVGAIETHGRYDTGALLLGLEILPPRELEYRGKRLQEFDLDRALARRPKVLLLDELAHTNAQGARHPKRWQDVAELLDAGVDVFTTLNVQHVESLNDVIAQITGVRVRETVPDSILDRANEVELVDIAPEELLNRLRDGKVYLPDQVARALSGFFQHGNLLALRELALRRTAERVDADVLAWRESQGVAATWPTAERVMVCVGPAPASRRVLRAGRRVAAGLRAPWVVAWVESLVPTLSDADRQRLEEHLKLAESLGAQVVRLTGQSVSESLLAYARKANVTRILVGKPTHSRLRDRLRGSLVDDIVRGSGDIDVHVVSGDPTPTPELVARDPELREATPVGGWLGAAGLAVATTIVALSIRAVYAVPDLEMLYLLAVIVAAVVFGRAPAVLAAALSVAAYDFFFVPPFLTFEVADVRYVLTFVMMFGVGLIAGTLMARIRAQERVAILREEKTRSLLAFSRVLAGQTNPMGAAAALAQHVSELLRMPTTVLLGHTGPLGPAASAPAPFVLAQPDLAVAQWAYEHGQPAGCGTDTLTGSKVLCVPLLTRRVSLGVMALSTQGHVVQSDQRALLDAFTSQTASALERMQLAADAEAASVRAKTEEMRSSLLSTVSHDLRTPLAAITGAATALKDETGPLSEAQRLELTESICDEAARLERLVANLLDMTKLQSGGIVPKRELIPPEELVGSALTRLDEQLRGREVKVSMEPELPLAHVDPVLLEQVLINLLDNAAKYTPAGTAIEVAVRRHHGGLAFEVSDVGPGLMPGEATKVFDKFYRGTHARSGGAGLGLPICKGIVEAHGGQLMAAPRVGGGVTFRFELPPATEQLA